jgi:phage terminase large subunit-like protein
VLDGVRLTHDDIAWPFDDQPPIYINKRARTFAYWDDDPNNTGVARRMPWQSPDYYEEQANTLRPEAYARYHQNIWTDSTNTFIPIEWWDACAANPPPPLPPGDSTPVVLGVDTSVSNDCSALVGVTRDPRDPATKVAVRFIQIWTPPRGGTIDYSEIDAAIRRLCAQYNVVCMTYDAYQMHMLAQDLRRDEVCWCKAFSQGARREEADKQFFDFIRDRRLAHTGHPEARQHIQNAAAKTAKEEDTRMRIIKKSEDAKVDFDVAASMAVYECMRLILH